MSSFARARQSQLSGQSHTHSAVQFGAIGGAISLLTIGQEMQKQTESMDQASAEAFMASKAEQMLASLWKLNALDVSHFQRNDTECSVLMVFLL